MVYRKVGAGKGNPELLAAVEQVVTRWLGYGYRRVMLALRQMGFSVSEYEVRKLLRENGLLARRPRGRGVTRPGPRELRAANLLKGEPAPSGLNQVWSADTTLVRTDSGPLYLAALLDLCSRKVVAWKLSRRNDEALVSDCLQQALAERRPPTGWIHHSDQGSPYTAAGYTRLVRHSGGRTSLCAPGQPRENAHIESFFRTLKLEEVDRNRYSGFLEAQAAIQRYIEHNYNATRMHSSLEYMSPDQHESRRHGAPR